MSRIFTLKEIIPFDLAAWSLEVVRVQEEHKSNRNQPADFHFPKHILASNPHDKDDNHLSNALANLYKIP